MVMFDWMHMMMNIHRDVNQTFSVDTCVLKHINQVYLWHINQVYL